MPVNRKRVRLLVAALRSGLYEKTKGRLHRTEPSSHWGGHPEGWCCLGVAADVMDKFGPGLTRAVSESGTCETFDGAVDYMPASVQAWYGFDSQDPLLRVDGRMIPASTLNDSGYIKEDGEHVELSLDDIGRLFRDTYLRKQK